MKERYLILGSGNAGVSAAQVIRDIDQTSPVTLVTLEKDLPYTRTMLTKNFSAIGRENPYAMHDAAWYQTCSIEILHGEVISIDTGNKQVQIKEEQTGHRSISYSKLVYALGSHSFIPPFAGADLPNVVSIRTTDDVRRLSGLLQTARSAAVIGGGVLGMEAAWEMRKIGKSVSIIEASPALMKRNLDQAAASILMEKAREQGVEILLDGKTRQITGEGIFLEDGRFVPAEVTVLSCGVRPNIEIARNAGLAVNRAVVVDQNMQTSIPDVYAAGDCVEFNGFCAGIWPVAGSTGKVAGANAAGRPDVYTPKTYSIMLNAFNTTLFSAGTITTEQSEELQLPKTWVKLFLDGGKPSGFIMIGDTRKGFTLAQKMESQTSLQDLVSFLRQHI